MRVTTSGLRSLIVNPRAFITAARMAAAAGQNYGNPQRQWIDAAIREYFREGKSAKALWETFDLKVQRQPSTPRREASATGAVKLLERFIQWDSADTELPADTFPPIRDVAIGEHLIAVRRDLVYIDAAGYRVRQLWTDHQLRPQHPMAIQMAAAVMISVEADLGANSTTAVEVWGLRHGVRQSWTRRQLINQVQLLRGRLDAVAQEIQGV